MDKGLVITTDDADMKRLYVKVISPMVHIFQIVNCPNTNFKSSISWEIAKSASQGLVT